jgi:adhesin transport system membrane fusion protein
MLMRLHSSSGTRRFAEFLPDTESMADGMHSPLAGILVLTITCAFGGLLAWSAMAEVEQVVQASGKIEPAERVKVVNHPDGGRIAEVHVVEGQPVAAGDPLVTFDGEVARAELADLLGRWQVRSAQAARLRAEADLAPPDFPAGLEQARPDLVAAETALLAERREAHASQREALDQTIERRSAEVKSLMADQARLGDSHSLLQEQVAAARQLAEKGLFPRLKLVDTERLLSNIVGEIAEGRERVNAAEAALAEAESHRDALDGEWRSGVLTELAAVTAERDRLTEALKRHRAVMRNLVVRAPVQGIVQDLAVAGGGQSVGSNQPLMKIVPTDGGLIIAARVANADIGYVRTGQPARIKVLAYDFLRFGTLEGQIARIAADATPDPKTGALSYEVTVRADQVELNRGGQGFSVVPGMTVQVDLMVGERTVLSYLTDRIFQLKEDAFTQG